MENKDKTTMSNTPAEKPQTTDNAQQQPTFQWEAPVLYTEDWLNTLAGGITDIIENGFYHT